MVSVVESIAQIYLHGRYEFGTNLYSTVTAYSNS